MSRPQAQRWALITSVAVALVALALSFMATAHAQGLDRLDAHQPPNLVQPEKDKSGILGWLEENKTLLLVCFGVLGTILVLAWILGQNTKTKKLQRDAIEKLRKSLLESSKATRGPAKRVWITGSTRDEPSLLGRYAGHHRSVDATWIAYRTWLFGQRRLLCVNSVDVIGLATPDLHVRAIGVNVTRGLGYAVPDVTDEDVRREWQRSVRRRLDSPETFSVAWKAFYAKAVDNAIAFYDALNASEDRSFLRQEVTRSPDELTETIIAPAKPAPPPEEASPDA